MSTESESDEVHAGFERSLNHRDLYLFMPFILGFASRESRREDAESQQELREGTTTENSPTRDRVILVNPFTQGMAVIEGASGFDALFRGLVASKEGQPPASKESVDAMLRVEIGEDDAVGECAICLQDWVVGDVARDMPCKHRFHGECIEEWLRIHGTCPVCRDKMPVDKEEVGKKREIWLSFSVNPRVQRTEEDGSDQSQNSDNGDGAAENSDASPRSSDQRTDG